jgi:hypothetical protein
MFFWGLYFGRRRVKPVLCKYLAKLSKTLYFVDVGFCNQAIYNWLHGEDSIGSCRAARISFIRFQKYPGWEEIDELMDKVMVNESILFLLTWRRSNWRRKFFQLGNIAGCGLTTIKWAKRGQLVLLEMQTTIKQFPLVSN